MSRLNQLVLDQPAITILSIVVSAIVQIIILVLHLDVNVICPPVP